MNQPDTDLQHSLLEALRPNDWSDEGETSPWQPNSLGEADWCARKATEAMRNVAAIKAEAERQIDAIKRWAEAATAEPLKDAEFFEGHALNWFARYRAEQAAGGTPGSKVTKTLELPGGATLKARQLPEKVILLDETAAITWAETHSAEHLIRVKKSLALAEIKKHIKDTGELPEGVELELGEIKLSLSVGDPA